MKILKIDVVCDGDFEKNLFESEDGIKLVMSSSCARIKRANMVLSFEFNADDKLFLNGYQSWTKSREAGLKYVDKSMKYCPKFLDKKFGFSAYGDGTFYKRSYKKGVRHGYTYAYVRRGKEYILFASNAENSGFTRIIFNSNANTVTLEKDCVGREVNGEFTLFDVSILRGYETEVFDKWFALLGVSSLASKKLSGYSSWYNYYQNISEIIIDNDLASISALEKKPNIFQIDDGYERKVGDWLEVDKVKFPQGLQPICDRIVKNGFIPGIWLAPFVCERESALFSEHPDWLLKSDGGFVYGGCNWSGMYALDFYNPDVKNYVRDCIEHYKAMGFKLFKLDFLYAVCMQPRADKTRGEIMYEAMDFLREVCGDCAILACGVPLSAAFGKVEFCRIGMDMSLEWDDKPFMRLFHPERPSTKYTMLNTIYRRQLSGRAFLNDPDVFLLRDYNMSLSNGQKRALATVNCLFGGLLFVSDDFGRYTDEQMELYYKLMSLTAAEVENIIEERGVMRIDYILNNQKFSLEYKI